MLAGLLVRGPSRWLCLLGREEAVCRVCKLGFFITEARCPWQCSCGGLHHVLEGSTPTGPTSKTAAGAPAGGGSRAAAVGGLGRRLCPVLASGPLPSVRSAHVHVPAAPLGRPAGWGSAGQVPAGMAAVRPRGSVLGQPAGTLLAKGLWGGVVMRPLSP